MTYHEIERILALPNGAAEIGPIALDPPVSITGCPGRKGIKCSAQQIGLFKRNEW